MKQNITESEIDVISDPEIQLLDTPTFQMYYYTLNNMKVPHNTKGPAIKRIISNNSYSLTYMIHGKLEERLNGPTIIHFKDDKIVRELFFADERFYSKENYYALPKVQIFMNGLELFE